MQGKTKALIQVALVVLFILAAVRLYLSFSERKEPGVQMTTRHEVDTGLSADAYVVPRPSHAYDLKSAAKALAGQPVWVREGYKYTYYPVAGGRVDFKHEGGLMGPIERVDVMDVREVPSPNPGQKQIVIVFDKDGKSYALPIGTAVGRDYNIYADEELYIQDPRQLYKHWSPDVWQAIAQHQVKPGMNELQASFAIGMGAPQQSRDPEVRTVVYPNGGKQVTVTYRQGKATRIDAG
jgi:hypothetical protein